MSNTILTYLYISVQPVQAVVQVTLDIWEWIHLFKQ